MDYPRMDVNLISNTRREPQTLPPQCLPDQFAGNLPRALISHFRDLRCELPGGFGINSHLTSPRTSYSPATLPEVPNHSYSAGSTSGVQQMSPAHSPRLVSTDGVHSNVRFLGGSNIFFAKKLVNGEIECTQSSEPKQVPHSPYNHGNTNAKVTSTSGEATKGEYSSSNVATPGGSVREEGAECRYHPWIKNNLPAWRSRAKLMWKFCVLFEENAAYKSKAMEMIKEIAAMQHFLIARGYNGPLPPQDELLLLYDELRRKGFR